MAIPEGLGAFPESKVLVPEERRAREAPTNPLRERRGWPRVPCQASVVVTAEGRRHAVCLVELGRGGGFVLTDTEWVPGTLIRLESPECSSLTFEAKVVDTCLGGVRFAFLNPPVDVRHLLPPSKDFRTFLDEHPEYHAPVPWIFALAHPLFQLIRTYFRLEVRGTEHIPYGSRFIWTHNHSGWLAVDAPLVGYLIARGNFVERYPWPRESGGLKGQLWRLAPVQVGDWGITFWNRAVMGWPLVPRLLKAMHGVPASVLRHPERLRKYRILATPAEGEEGNCKSSFTERYRLQYFHTGVARLALEAELDYILPAAVVGPEESFPNLAKLRWPKSLLGTVLPLPLPVLPIPVQWHVEFLPPIDVRRYREAWRACADQEERYALCCRIMAVVRREVEQAMDRILDGRKAFRPWFLV